MAPRINIPPVTRGLLITMVALSFLYYLTRFRSATANQPEVHQIAVPYLTLLPSMCLYYPWTFITTTFVEQNVVMLVVNGVNVFFGGKYLERAWGSKGFGIAFLVAAIIPNLIAAPTYLFWSSITGDPLTASTPVSGGITIQAAFLVAFKQLVPEHTVSLFRGFVKVRVKHFPAIFLLANTLSGFILGTDTAAIFAWVGLVNFWIYLRFFKRQPNLSSTSTGDHGLKGDASETFAFATFFPNIMQPPIAAVCDQIFALLCNMKICTPFSDEAVASGNEQAAARGEGGLPNLLNQARSSKGMAKREEAERRRALALKALDQRLTASASRAASVPVTVTPAVSQGHDELGKTDYAPEDGQ